MKNIMITGGAGFIGSYLAEKCIKEGHKVTIISRRDTKNIDGIREKVTLKIMDVRDINKEVEGQDYIFHLAGSTDNYAIIEGQPYRDVEANCMTTIALLEACRKHNPEARIILASTFFVNGRPEKLPVTPEMACNPLGLYGATRLAAEHFCEIYHNIFGLDTVIARFSNVFGARERRDNKKKAGFNYLINLALQNQEIQLYDNGDFYRDYIYVTDVAEACMTIAEKGETGKIYYVSRGEFVKFKELINMTIEEAGGGKIKPIEPPDFHKKVGIKDFVCDNTPLKKLGWKPKVTLKEGIRKTIEYYKTHKE